MDHQNDLLCVSQTEGMPSYFDDLLDVAKESEEYWSVLKYLLI